MTTQHFLFIFLSLYTIQSYGMENNAAEIARRAHKHAENSEKRNYHKFGITALCKLLSQGKPIYLHSQEKKFLQTSLEQNVKSLKECYSTADEYNMAETWSGDDHDAKKHGEQIIELLKKELTQ